MPRIIITDALLKDLKDLVKHRNEFSLSLPIRTNHVMVARTQTGELIGFMELCYSNPKFIELKKLAVRKKYRRIGVGRKLVGVARSIAIKNNQTILLNSKLTPDAQNFWKKKQGFKKMVSNSRPDLFEELVLKPKRVKRKKKFKLRISQTKRHFIK